ncbi:hypothetical protein P0D72_06000 [Paraburkholderia sediminicola]|uniref:hypothetical protein n=1 Tax=Paraburkholderia sediminicola TaxID=458836 RepID=UPI0038B850C5
MCVAAKQIAVSRAAPLGAAHRLSCRWMVTRGCDAPESHVLRLAKKAKADFVVAKRPFQKDCSEGLKVFQQTRE